LGLRVTLAKNDLRIPTITDIIPGALFTERETQEMMGVEVIGIPDKRRLFLPDDFPDGVYPWRKDETGPQDLLRVLPGREPKYGNG
jgi:membrane-bound hydrogenase subunit beta